MFHCTAAIEGRNRFGLSDLLERPALLPAPVHGSIDENSTHRLGGCGKEMPAGIPMLSLLDFHETNVGIMHEGRSLQRMPWLFIGKLRCHQLSHVVID